MPAFGQTCPLSRVAPLAASRSAERLRPRSDFESRDEVKKNVSSGSAARPPPSP